MLSFELSAIDLILAIAVIILLILYVTKSSAKPPTGKKLLVEEERHSKKPTIEDESPKKEIERPTVKPQSDSTKCPYGFGYLKKLDKDAAIPDECLSCSRIMECYSAKE
jgi:hypothetical protein